MSQLPNPGFSQPMQSPHPVPPPQQNNAGLIGFIVSIVGLFLCGIPSIIGVIISIVGLTKKPKGFAIAGLLIGLLGLIELVGVGIAGYRGYQLAQNAGDILKEFGVKIELQQEAMTIGNEWERTSRILTQSEGDELLKGKRDALGNQIIYETDGVSFSLRSAGPDGTLDTEDDILVGPFSDAESTQEFDFSEEHSSDW